MYFLIAFLSILISTCNYTMSVPVQSETEMEEMIPIDCNSNHIQSKLEELTQYFDSLKQQESVAKLLRSDKGIFENRKDASTSESFKNSNASKYKLTVIDLETCNNTCYNNNKSNACNYNNYIHYVTNNSSLKDTTFLVNVEAIQKNAGKYVRKKNENIYECVCIENYKISVSTSLNVLLNQFLQFLLTNDENIMTCHSHHALASILVLLKCRPKIGSAYLELWVKNTLKLKNPSVTRRPQSRSAGYHDRADYANDNVHCSHSNNESGNPTSSNYNDDLLELNLLLHFENSCVIPATSDHLPDLNPFSSSQYHHSTDGGHGSDGGHGFDGGHGSDW